MTVSSLKLWRATVSMAAKMLNNSGNITHPDRSPLLHLEAIRTDAVIRSHTISSHPIVELIVGLLL